MNEIKVRGSIEYNDIHLQRNQLGGGVISEGGYGCVFYPKITCSGKTTNNTKYISKLQKINFFSHNEQHISSLIKQIDNYDNFFSVILSHCDVSLNKITAKDMESCENTLNGISKAVLFNLKYINNKNIYSILTSRNLIKDGVDDDYYKEYSLKHTIFIIINTYKMILGSLSKLHEHGIIHYDLKHDNVLYDIDRNIPIIIDFGISIDIKQLNQTTYKKHFYIFYPEYYIWCLDIHYICYLLHVNKSPKKDEIEEICDKFIKHNSVLKMFSPEFVAKYRTSCIKALSRFIGKDYLFVIEKLLEQTETWDLYSFSIIYLTILEFWFARGFEENSFIIEFSRLLLQNIQPNNKKRNSIKETIKLFSGFFYTNTNRQNIEGILNNVEDNYDMIKLEIIAKKKKLHTLKKGITV